MGVNRKVVLCIEGGRGWYDIWCYKLRIKILKEEVILLSAETIAEAEELFTSNRGDITAIVIGELEDDLEPFPSTRCLVQKFRKSLFMGPIVVASGDEEYRHQLIEVGCNHESTRCTLTEKLTELLHLK